jgi:hypothetical protein
MEPDNANALEASEAMAPPSKRSVRKRNSIDNQVALGAPEAGPRTKRRSSISGSESMELMLKEHPYVRHAEEPLSRNRSQSSPSAVPSSIKHLPFPIPPSYQSSSYSASTPLIRSRLSTVITESPPKKQDTERFIQ